MYIAPLPLHTTLTVEIVLVGAGEGPRGRYIREAPLLLSSECCESDDCVYWQIHTQHSILWLHAQQEQC